MVLGDTSLWYEVKVLIWPRKTVWLFWLLLLLQIGLLFCNNVKSLVLFFSISFALIFDLVKTCQDRQTLYCKYCSLQVKFVKNLSLVVLSDDEHKLRHVRHTELSVVVLWFRGTKHFPACVLSAVLATRQYQTGNWENRQLFLNLCQKLCSIRTIFVGIFRMVLTFSEVKLKL